MSASSVSEPGSLTILNQGSIDSLSNSIVYDKNTIFAAKIKIK
jgi:hypothetical protein